MNFVAIILLFICTASHASIGDLVNYAEVRGNLNPEDNDENQGTSLAVDFEFGQDSRNDFFGDSRLYIEHSLSGPDRVKIRFVGREAWRTSKPQSRDPNFGILGVLSLAYDKNESIDLDDFIGGTILRLGRNYDSSSDSIRLFISAVFNVVGAAYVEHPDGDDTGFYSGGEFSIELDVGDRFRAVLGTEQKVVFADKAIHLHEYFLELSYLLTDALEVFIRGSHDRFDFATDSAERSNSDYTQGLVGIRYYPKGKKYGGRDWVRFSRERNLLR